jgi:hypothetical protein
MDYPKDFLKDVYWSFNLETSEKQSEFEQELSDYHKEISGKKLPIKLDKIIFPFPEIVIQYDVWSDEEDDYIEPQIKLEADSKKGFKAGELLYKVHMQIADILAEGDRYFFEGFQFATDDDPDFEGIAVYFLLQGS